MTIKAQAQAITKDVDRIQFYKLHSVQGDCEFALDRAGRFPLPFELESAWLTLLATVQGAKKETPSHRRERDRIRNQVRVWLDVSSRFDRREDRKVA